MAEPAELYLAIDQGGHASRALVFDARGAVVARGLKEVHVHHPQPDRVEQDPEELIASIRAAIDAAVGALGSRARAIVAAGLATQRSSIVCWDRATGTALSPVISWQDRRAHAWLGQFSARAGDIHHRTGLMLSAHYGASKLRWCLDHLPPVKQAQVDGRLAMGPLASFLLFRLLEERPLWVDPANAGRTLLWNLTTRDWDPELLRWFGIPVAVLPRCVPTRYRFGTLRIGAQALPVTVMNGDQSAALFAYGAPRADTAYINMGTGAFVSRTLGHHPGDSPRLLTGVVLDDGQELTYVIEGTVNGAGAALDWIGAELGITDIETSLPAWLAQKSEPPLFLNGISGLGAPFWIPDFVSRFLGEGAGWQKVVAVAESIVFLLQVNLEELPALAPPLARLCVTGGLSGYDGLCQRLADLSGVPVYRPVESEATARGTAFLLAGGPADWPEPVPGMWFKPQLNLALRARYERWRAAMPTVIG
jgi:glycerol kinase